jgi:uncharacterized protein YigE (DUF2233 family)
MLHAIRIALIAAMAAAPSGAAAACRAESFEGKTFTACSFDLAETDLRIFWRDEKGRPFRSFSALADDLESRGLSLGFAMNAGMYQADLTPVGLLIQDGREVRKANTYDAPAGLKPVPNFYKKPNGVFYVDADEAGVMETGAFLNARPETAFATQSGPLLVLDGEIHPAFIIGSTDLNARNGVGVSAPGRVHFAISEEPVNFHDFARFFRDVLGCDDALFLDGGSASGLYAPEIGRNDWPPWEGYGPIVGVVE